MAQTYVHNSSIKPGKHKKNYDIIHLAEEILFISGSQVENREYLSFINDASLRNQPKKPCLLLVQVSSEFVDFHCQRICSYQT
jgi:hypothetical protein